MVDQTAIERVARALSAFVAYAEVDVPDDGLWRDWLPMARVAVGAMETGGNLTITPADLSISNLEDRCQCGFASAAECAAMPMRHCGLWDEASAAGGVTDLF